jgi:hypothetical protein
MKQAERGWIGVDFDRTLAHYEDWETNGQNLGAPIPLMVERIKRWIAMGQAVRIFTARAAKNSPRRDFDIDHIRIWCLAHIGYDLPVTAEKDFQCIAIWDDRGVAVEPNTGLALSDSETDPLDYDEEITMAYDLELPCTLHQEVG